MARFAVSGFAVTSDVLPCPDPWDQGMVFKMHRWGSKRHKQFQQSRWESDPLTARAMAKKIKRDLAEARAPQEPKLINGAPVVVSDTAPPVAAAPTDTLQDCFLEAVEELLDKDGANVFTILANRDGARDEVVALCDGWSGVTDQDSGADVAFSEVAFRDLLDIDAVVREGMAYEGETVGDALTKHLLRFVQEHSLARAKYLEAGEKNSEGSSAGA